MIVDDDNTNVMPRRTVETRQTAKPAQPASEQTATTLPTDSPGNQPPAAPMRTRSGRVVTLPARYKD